MRLLVLGGTAWLGRTTAQAALDAGHAVACATRGDGIPAGAQRIRIDRDDPDGLAPLHGQTWDAVIDVAREPGHVRRATRALADAAGRYVFVSTCNVYADQSTIGADETAPLLPPLDADEMASLEDYGSAKVAGEQAVVAAFGADRSALVRPGLIGGPGDPTGRSTYWPRRFARPSSSDGAVLSPDAPQLPTALLDVRDLAAWLVHLASGHGAGAYDAAGASLLLPAHLATAQRAAGHRGSIVAAGEDRLIAEGVAQWAGPRSLPLWLADRDWYGMNARSVERAVADGLVRRPLEETLRDTIDGGPVVTGAGLTDEEERALLRDLA
ncbi:NAD-dependent epimerase/dehydratase family protein [Microbacterium sp. NPDC089189]|uniref:NAD-dependent epimerase/dehydratase family protein n=1 Tax=Microbacterium sp. NPDC089189 TaxID=3154972 RepID=UPI00342EBF85